MRSITSRLILLAALGLVLASFPLAAQATVISSSSYGADGIFTLGVGASYGSPTTVGPDSNATGSGAAAYSVTDPRSMPSLTQNVPVALGTLGIVLGAASTDTSASFDGSSTTTGTSTITGPDTITITFTPTGGSALTLFTASVPLSFSSSASVLGDYGTLSAAGSSTVTASGPVTIWGTLFGQTSWSQGWTVSGSIAANTVYWDDGITRLVLDEQTTDCSSSPGSCNITVNALHFTINDPTGSLFGTPLYTDLIVGQSYAAQIASLPEPALGLLLLGGLGLVATVRRRSARTS
jgi:hypothetical protein